MWIDERKKRYFFSGGQGYNISAGIPDAQQWRRQYELCDCYTCTDQACKARMRDERFPADAGGGSQCWRMVQSEPDVIAWQNPNGTVVIVERIRGK